MADELSTISPLPEVRNESHDESSDRNLDMFENWTNEEERRQRTQRLNRIMQ